MSGLCMARWGRFPSETHKATARKLFASVGPRKQSEDFVDALASYDFCL